MKSPISTERATFNTATRIADPIGVADVLEGDEIRQINHDTKREDELDEGLDDAIAEEEEDDELEEEDEVEAAAAANRN